MALISLFYSIKLYIYIIYICVCVCVCVHRHSKKVNMEKHSTFAVFSEVSVVEGPLSKSSERASMGSWASAGF